MTKLNLVLLLAVIATSLLLIRSAYDARRLFTAIHRSEVEALRLAGEHKRLEAERQAQATNLRVDRTARERLAMRSATPAVTFYVVDPLAPGASTAAAAPSSELAAVPASGVAQ
jgi:cell division protein FtsL